jgi:hypothetical protein
MRADCCCVSSVVLLRLKRAVQSRSHAPAWVEDDPYYPGFPQEHRVRIVNLGGDNVGADRGGILLGLRLSSFLRKMRVMIG